MKPVANRWHQDLMAAANQAHTAGRYDEALELTIVAFNVADEGSDGQAQAARNISARYDRLGQFDEAAEWADRAYGIHDDLVAAEWRPSRHALRERGVSALYVGVAGLRQLIADRRQASQAPDATPTIEAMRQAWQDLAQARLRALGFNHYADQYQINAARRVSVAESLFGSPSIGFKIGAQAVLLAGMSESPRLDTSNPDLNSVVRRQAKVKALKGGLAALAVGVLNSLPGSGSKRLALDLADSIL